MNNLKLLRESRGLSQQKLAEKFNLSQQSVYKYENQLAEPDLTTLMQFAEFFHTSVDYLIGYAKDDKPYSDASLMENLLTPNEAHHLVMYRHLSADNRKHLDSILESFAPDDNYKTKFQ
ncbi:MAG TPA: helix-turn-helix transcriptional regulator [Lachnospiraceae bacterium]|nr:helix-turn-helix transcriptional regulator [Lachnospiraceae bacterium]